MRFLFFLLLLPVFAFAECIAPTDGMIVNKSVDFCSSSYDVPNGIIISSGNVVLDCNTAVLRGNSGVSEIGIRIENADNVVLRNCNVVTFNQGLYLKNVTNSLVENNAFLKNNIGIRLLDSFENTIRGNNDKSFQLAVSAINSKYNVVIVGNKNIERAFCDENACNEHRDMRVCVSGDFYCSKKCSPETDSDCVSRASSNFSVKKNLSVNIASGDAEENLHLNESVDSAVSSSARQIPFLFKFIIYLVLYLAVFFALRLVKK